MKLKDKTVFLAIILIIFGGVAIADAFGVWVTESSKIPQKTEAGEYDPGDIRGSYSFEDINKSFDIAPEKIAEAFSIVSQQPETIKAKDIEGLYGDVEEGVEIGTGSVRCFVALYTGIPYESEDVLPVRAVEILYEEGKIEKNQKEALMAAAVNLSETVVQDLIEEDAENFQVKGKTTVQEVLNTGMPIEELEEIIGIKIESRSDLIKDLCANNGLSFSEIKSEINDRVR